MLFHWYLHIGTNIYVCNILIYHPHIVSESIKRSVELTLDLGPIPMTTPTTRLDHLLKDPDNSYHIRGQSTAYATKILIQTAFNAKTCNLDEANGALHPTTG